MINKEERIYNSSNADDKEFIKDGIVKNETLYGDLLYSHHNTVGWNVTKDGKCVDGWFQLESTPMITGNKQIITQIDEAIKMLEELKEKLS